MSRLRVSQMQLMEIKRTLQINLSTREKYDEETVLRDMQLLWCAYFIQRVTCACLRNWITTLYFLPFGRSRSYLKDCSRLFLISLENHRDCHITMSLSLETMEVQIKGDQWNKRFRTVQVYCSFSHVFRVPLINNLLFLEPPAPEKCYDYRKGEVSVHGCCWDGIISATGPGGQGCPGN